MANAENSLTARRKSRYVKPVASVVEISPEERLLLCVKTAQYDCRDWEGNPDVIST